MIYLPGGHVGSIQANGKRKQEGSLDTRPRMGHESHRYFEVRAYSMHNPLYNASDYL